MADLSNLLGDVYGDDGTGESAPEPPAWADDRRLDEAFADWKPEPLEPIVAKAISSAPLDDDLAAALSAALADAPRPTVPVERFAHVDAVEPIEPAVLDAATLEPVADPEPDPVEAAFDAIVIEPPTPVKRTRRSLSLPGRRTSSPVPPPPPMFSEPAATPTTAVPGGAWQRSDDDILPALSVGKKPIRLRLR